MAILESVVCGRFSSPLDVASEGTKEYVTKRELFTFEWSRVAVAVITSNHEISSVELDPSLLCFEVNDETKNPEIREWVLVNKEHLIEQFNQEKASVQINGKMDAGGLIKANQSLLFSMQALKAVLEWLKQEKSIDLWKNFSIGDVDKIASFIRENLPSWEGPRSEEHTSDLQSH